jgi:hypothetical protein
MTAQKETNMPKYKLASIELLDIHLYQTNKPQEEGKIYHFNINIEHKFNIEKKQIFAITSVNVLHEDNETLLGSVKVGCSFKVENIEEYTDIEKQSVEFPKEMLTNLNAEAISTTRGVMFANFSGTFLHKAYLPLIDPSHFFKEDNS